MERTKESLEQELTIHRQNLYVLEEQKARYGLHVPLHILHGIEYEREAIERINGLLRTHGYAEEEDEVLRTAIELAMVGGRMSLDHSRAIVAIKDKQITTEADIAINKEIKQGIIDTFGDDHTIISEEDIEHKKHNPQEWLEMAQAKGFTWVIDPLDGTINYYYDVPLLCTAIGILKDRKPYIGVVYDPIKCELYYAREGEPAFIEYVDLGVKQTMHPAAETKLAEAVVMTHLTTNRQEREKMTSCLLDAIANEVRHIRMLGSGQLALTYVAHGRFHVFMNNYTYPWDQVAGVVIVRCAGGTVTDFNGGPWTLGSTSIIACNNEAIHDRLLALVTKFYPRN